MRRPRRRTRRPQGPPGPIISEGNRIVNFANRKTAVFHYNRYLGLAPLNVTAGADTFASYNFQLNDMLNVSELTSLYDQYKILLVEVHFRPGVTQSTSNSTGQLAVAIDYDDNVVPTASSQVLQYGDLVHADFRKTVSVRLKPRPAISGTTGAAFVAPRNIWLDCGYPTVPHFGLKIFARSTVDNSYTVAARYSLVFRHNI
jgi:hypothetical protein